MQFDAVYCFMKKDYSNETAKASNINGLNILFHCILISICILKMN